jgi:hypothetical protein
MDLKGSGKVTTAFKLKSFIVDWIKTKQNKYYTISKLVILWIINCWFLFYSRLLHL